MALDVLHLAQGTCRPYQSCQPRTVLLPQTLPMSTSTGTIDISIPANLQQRLESIARSCSTAVLGALVHHFRLMQREYATVLLCCFHVGQYHPARYQLSLVWQLCQRAPQSIQGFPPVCRPCSTHQKRLCKLRISAACLWRSCRQS